MQASLVALQDQNRALQSRVNSHIRTTETQTDDEDQEGDLAQDSLSHILMSQKQIIASKDGTIDDLTAKLSKRDELLSFAETQLDTLTQTNAQNLHLLVKAQEETQLRNDAAEAEKRELEAQLLTKDTSIVDLKHQVEVLTSRYQQTIQGLERNVLVLSEQVSKELVHIASLRARVASVEADNAALQQSVSSLRMEKEEALQQLRLANRSSVELTEQLEALKHRHFNDSQINTTVC